MTEGETYTGPDGEEYVLPAHDCDGGWLGEDAEGRPRPCPVCRDHLRRRRADLEAGMSGWTSKRDPHDHGRDEDQ